MRIYELQRSFPLSSREIPPFVLIAETPDRARCLAAETLPPEERPPWLSDALSTLTDIGWAGPDQGPRVVTSPPRPVSPQLITISLPPELDHDLTAALLRAVAGLVERDTTPYPPNGGTPCSS